MIYQDAFNANNCLTSLLQTPALNIKIPVIYALIDKNSAKFSVISLKNREFSRDEYAANCDLHRFVSGFSPH
jgi:hypothetical protein